VSERALEAADRSGLIRSGEPLLVMLSGGADSVCLLDVSRRLGARVSALHVNHGLRPGADADEAHCRALCESLEIPLAVERPALESADGPGNLQAEARDARYALAERHADGDYAAAHTLTDQAETMLYRLAVSPGRRALLGMAPRRGRLVRPLLEATRADTEAYCRQHGLAWSEDPSNRDPAFARSRVRHEVLAVLRELNPAAERTIAETGALLRDEAEVLESMVDGVLEELGGGMALPLAELGARPPALARLALRRAAELAAAGAGMPDPALSRRDAEAILAAGSAGSKSFDLGGGLRAVVEYGFVRFAYGAGPAAAEPVPLRVPGSVRFGGWEVEASLGPGGDAVVDAAAIGDRALVRAWREGDRMRPAGLGGTKTLQDLFTDRKVPRELRRTLPVVEVDGEIAWVAGVALGERFLAGSGGVVSLTARRRT
jgi:tRNA(Ile)-lysidine synthase